MEHKTLRVVLSNGRMAFEGVEGFSIDLKSPELKVGDLYNAVFSTVETPTSFTVSASPEVTKDSKLSGMLCSSHSKRLRISSDEYSLITNDSTSRIIPWESVDETTYTPSDSHRMGSISVSRHSAILRELIALSCVSAKLSIK